MGTFGRADKMDDADGHLQERGEGYFCRAILQKSEEDLGGVCKAVNYANVVRQGC
jgi:hypothetical protein